MALAAKSIIVIDTETADLTGMVYDVGYTITNKKGEILLERNWLVEEIFEEADIMMGAFYAKKIFTHYARMLQNGEIRLTPWMDIVMAMRSDMAKFKVDVIAAYNLGFDSRVLASTHKALGHTDKVMARKAQLLDIWQFACETKLSQKAYKKVAIDQGWISPAGNIKTGAEFAYRFCISDYGFIEDHTALSDARIETEILRQCYAQKKSVPYGKINAQPWRIVNGKTAKNDNHVHGSVTA